MIKLYLTKNYENNDTATIKADLVEVHKNLKQYLDKFTLSLVDSTNKPAKALLTTDENLPEEITFLDWNPEHTLETIFSGIYHRDEHIRIMDDVFTEFILDHSHPPAHVLLYGEPSACKTTLLCRFQTYYAAKYGREIVKLFDAPTLTKAGLENWFIEALEDDAVPPIIGIEEIEKTNMDNLSVLLTVMESKRIRKLNARINIDKPLNVLITATCNDARLLKRFRNGALWSRFSHKLPCKKPDKDTMRHILIEKIKARGGDVQIADAIIDFVYHQFKSKFGDYYAGGDARAVIGLLSNGKRLLNGSAQRDIITMVHKNGGLKAII